MIKMEKFDVIVVGAGPAGAISSYYLSKKGLNVALLEKGQLGRDKICGGGISHYTLNELPFSIPTGLIEQRIKGINFISPANDIFQKKESKEIGVTVYRSKFDEYLIHKAIDANVTFLSNFKVSNVKKSDSQFTIQNKYSSRYIIGADGVNSVIRTTFNLGEKKRPLNLGLRSIIELPESEVDNFLIDKETFEFYFQNHHPGYGWIFGLRNAINIGIGTKMTNPASKKIMKLFVKKAFKLRKMKVPSYKIEGFPIPNSKLPKQFSKNKVFLVGDAGGLVDPVSGEGVHYAVRSGKIVADTILKDSYQPMQENLDRYYAKNIKQDIGTDLFVSYRLNLFLERFFLHNMKFWFTMLRRNPFIFNYASQLAVKSNYYAVYKDVLNKLPTITLNTILPRVSIPGYTFKDYQASNPVFG